MKLSVLGDTIFATTGGRHFDPALSVVLFLHGAGFDHSVWSLQTRYFAHHGFSVLSVDLPGHGRSSGTPPDEIGEMADWIPELLDVAGIRVASLVGHSMGALLAMECAVRHPQRVRSLSLLGTAAAMPVHPGLLEAARRNDPLAYELVCSWGLGPRGHLGGAPVPGTSLMGSGRSLLASGPSNVLAVGLQACNAYDSGRQTAESVACPTLVIVGTADRMTPVAWGKELAGWIRDCKLEVMQSCGHMMMLEDSKACLKALKQHI